MSTSPDVWLEKDTIVVRTEGATYLYSQSNGKVAKVARLTPGCQADLQKAGFFRNIPRSMHYRPPHGDKGLMLLMSKACPMACRYCYAHGGCENALMTPEIAERSVSAYLQTFHPSRPRVNFFGAGEPTMNQVAIKHLVGIYGARIRWKISTSGVLPKHFLRWLIDHHVSITVSVDGPPFIQDDLRPLRGGYSSSLLVEKTLRALQGVSGQSMSVRTTVTHETLPNLPDVLEYFNNLGVSFIHLEGMYSLGRALEKDLSKGPLTPLDLFDRIKLMLIALDWAESTGKLIRIGSLNHILSPRIAAYCGAMAGQTITVNHVGQLTACSEVADETFKGWDLFNIGRVGQNDEFDFYSDKLTQLARRTTTKMPTCRTCFAKYLCRGGCAYRAWVSTSNMFTPDPKHCEFIKVAMPLLIQRMVEHRTSHK